MLASDYDAERATAGAKIAEMARSNQMTVTEFVAKLFHPTTKPTPIAVAPQPQPQPPAEHELIQAIVNCRIQFQHLFNEWEQQFTSPESVRKWTRFGLSDRQRKAIFRILRKYYPER